MQQGIVVLTEGEKGAQLFTQQKHIKQKMHQPEIFADTVGAGDTFFSAMIAQLLRDKALQPDADNEKSAFALRFASLAAALNISHVGCHPPTYSQVAALL
jgi:fructokinase